MSDSLINEWFRIVSQTEVQGMMVNGSGFANYIVTKPYQPVIFTDHTLHEAKALTKE